jgi:hypothetical protein
MRLTGRFALPSGSISEHTFGLLTLNFGFDTILNGGKKVRR